MNVQNSTPPTTDLDFDFEKCVSIDENIECFGLINDKNIIENINLSKNEMSVTKEPYESTDSEENNNLKPITKTQAMESLHVRMGNNYCETFWNEFLRNDKNEYENIYLKLKTTLYFRGLKYAARVPHPARIV